LNISCRHHFYLQMLLNLVLFLLGTSVPATKSSYYDYDHRLQDLQDRQHLLPHDKQHLPPRNKLLVIVLAGFRWDYFKIYKERTGKELEGFKRFMSEGVRTEYLESVFPAESFPALQTIQTGLYPESHGIVGNQFYDNEVHKMTDNYLAFFNIDDERTTSHMSWWQKDGVEPIWATAARNDISFATFLWGRCDIPYDGVKRYSPAFCENYYTMDRTKTLTINVDNAMRHLMNGVDAAIIYDSSLERCGKLKGLDAAMTHLEDRLNVTTMNWFVNVVVMSDHGMTYHGDEVGRKVEIRKVKLSDHLIQGTYRWIVGSGSHAGVYPRNKKLWADLVTRLQGIEGVRVYNRTEIPEDLHYKNNKNSPPILVMAEPGTIILPSRRGVQKPGSWRVTENLIDQTEIGLSGYDPKEPDMRGIFLAKGPDFKSTGSEYPPIKLVDVYQVFTHLLGLDPQPNNGTWEDVKDLLLDLEEPNSANRTIGVLQTVMLALLVKKLCT